VTRSVSKVFGGFLAIALTVVSLASAQVLETSEGKVEFIGLHHWKPAQVRDTLAVLRPDVPLTSGACAVVLRSEAGFPEAAVISFSFPDGSFEDHTMISLVEPEEADRVRYGAFPADSLAPPDRWERVHEILVTGGWAAWRLALQHRSRDISPAMGSREAGEDSTNYLEFRAFLESRSTQQDLRTAINVLSGDRDGFNRQIAVGILGGFPERPESWHAMVRAARGFGPEDPGRDAAAGMIRASAHKVPNSIDWAPVADDLAALLSGTNLYAFEPVLGLLTRTGLPLALTRDLLADGAPLVVDHLAAWSLMPRQTARRFLERVSGEEHGDDVPAWRAWIASLQETRAAGK
jgi:hypothetical protein